MIDDDQDDREIFQEAIAISYPGIEVVFARDGVDALEILDRNNTLPDVIFLDYNMPRMNGVQCLKELKGMDRTSSIPVIMYTTSGNRSHEEHILKLGADYYMRKTNSFHELCSELKRLLSTVESNAPLHDPGDIIN